MTTTERSLMINAMDWLDDTLEAALLLQSPLVRRFVEHEGAEMHLYSAGSDERSEIGGWVSITENGKRYRHQFRLLLSQCNFVTLKGTFQDMLGELFLLLDKGLNFAVVPG